MDHLWEIQPKYLGTENFDYDVIQIKSQIIRIIENQMGYSRYDIFSYNPKIYD